MSRLIDVYDVDDVTDDVPQTLRMNVYPVMMQRTHHQGIIHPGYLGGFHETDWRGRDAILDSIAVWTSTRTEVSWFANNE